MNVVTEKLYLKDSYIFESISEITDVRFFESFIDVALDKTPFFPGGGGQPADEGFIENYPVCSVREDNGIVFHRLENNSFSPKIGDVVSVKLADDIRLERMRAHTGEHLLSGLAHNLFGANNVGFHMDEHCVMTVDFDCCLDTEKLSLLEYNVNQYVMRNLLVTVDTISAEKASELVFRSKIDFDSDIRIVEISGIDKCACCAPHLRSTGEVGSVKILSHCSHRGGVRLTLICGEKAYFEFAKRYAQILNISSMLCSKYDNADKSVLELVDTNKNLKFEINKLKNTGLNLIADKIVVSEIVCEFIDDASIDDLRVIGNRVYNESCKVLYLLSATEEGFYNYCIMSDKLNLKLLIRDMNEKLNGRGGGKGILAQGCFNVDKAAIITYIEELKVENYENA